MRLISEEEYQELLMSKNQYHQLVERLNSVSKELYNKPYYEGPFVISVALEQVYDMYSEIKHKRQPWYKRL